MASIEVRVPDIGDLDKVAVIELLVKPGDTVHAGQSLVTVESDKASMEIPASEGGVLTQWLVRLGDKVSEGSALALLEAQAAVPELPAKTIAAPAAAPAPVTMVASPAPRALPTAALPPHEPAAPRGRLPHASPSVRRFARELGVELALVKGSGPAGRICAADVQAFIKSAMSQEAAPAKAADAASGAALGLLPWPTPDFAKFGPIERRDLPRIRKISGANLHRNWVMIPHVTNHEDADITELEAFRVQMNRENEKSGKSGGPKLTMLALLLKACAAALKKFPEFNSSLDGEQLVLKNYWHIGFAADTPAGLVVPVIRDVDRKGLLQIALEMGELAGKAREGKLGPADMAGASFTVSSLGGIGGRYFTPIINAPEVAILGVCRSQMQPAWDGKQFQPRLMLPMSLAWDHRVIDGALAARFNQYLVHLLGDMRRLLL